jgi:hypothetical protein
MKVGNSSENCVIRELNPKKIGMENIRLNYRKCDKSRPSGNNNEVDPGISDQEITPTKRKKHKWMTF